MMKHTEDFKQDTVRIALTSGLSPQRVAAGLRVGLSTLGNWVRCIGQPIWHQSVGF